MSNIKKRVEDARFNYQHGLNESALCLLLSAIDGSAAKLFPKGTISINNPKTKKGKEIEMGNKERYTRFLGVRLAQVMGLDTTDEAYYNSKPFSLIVGDASPEKVIYTAFRCSDSHEAGLPPDLKYVFDNGISNKYQLEKTDNEFRFSSGFLKMLEQVVVEAPCNGLAFGINHYRLFPKNQMTNAEYTEALSHSFNISFGRVELVKKLIQMVGPEAVDMDDITLAASLTSKLDRHLPLGARHGLFYIRTAEPICLLQGGFTIFGLSIAKTILKTCELRDIAS